MNRPGPSARIAAAAFLLLSSASALPAQQDPMAKHVSEAAAASAPTLTERYGADDLRSGSLRLPAGKGPFPVVVLIHGGCWTKGFAKRADMEAIGEKLAAKGIAVWNIEYRQLGDEGGGYPGTFEDIAAGVDHVATLAGKHPLKLDQVSIVGHSAGAHLALWAASRHKLGGAWAASAKIKPASVVAIDGPGMLAPLVGMDAQVCGKPVIAPLMGGTPAEQPARYAFASPGANLPLGTRQLLVQADFAPMVGPYAAAATAAGDTVDILTPANANHFDIVTPSTTNGAAVIDFIVQKAFATK